MSDFFANLAARTQEGEPSIRPRLAGRFEPVMPIAQLAEMTVDADASAVPPPPDVQSRPTTEPSPTMDRHSPPKTPAMVPDPAPTLAGDPAVRPQPVPAADRPTAKEDAPPRFDAMVAADRPLPTSMGVPIPLRSQARTPASRGPLARSMNNTLTAPNVEAARPGAPPAMAPAPIPAASWPPNLLPPRTNPPAEVPTRRRERAGIPDRAAAPFAEPETVVHVNIGRIELRVPNPPGRTRPKPSSAVTPLSEYLRQRAAKVKS